jgi:hypothetical protein
MNDEQLSKYALLSIYDNEDVNYSETLSETEMPVRPPRQNPGERYGINLTETVELNPRDSLV